MVGWQALAGEESPRAEIFGGYQYTRVGIVPGVNANGWNASVTGNAASWFGVTADFSGAYRSIGGIGLRAHTFTFGPTVALRGSRVTPFAHFLAGGFHASTGATNIGISLNGFAMIAGGGVDIRASRAVAVRLFQFDWLTWRSQGITEKRNARISAGIVFRVK